MGDHRTPPKPPYFDTVPPGTCRWCNQEVGLTKTGKQSKSRWHASCLKDYKLIHWPTTTRRAVFKRDRGVCASCGVKCDKHNNRWHMDHRKPLIEAKGDLDYWKLPNLQTLCTPCHTLKTSQEATERAAKRRADKDKNA